MDDRCRNRAKRPIAISFPLAAANSVAEPPVTVWEIEP